MHFLAVLSAAALIQTSLAIQPATHEPSKRTPTRHGRWWKSKQNKQVQAHTINATTYPMDPISSIDPLSSSAPSSTIADPFTSTTELLSSTTPYLSSSSAVTQSYIYPNTTYTYPNITYPTNTTTLASATSAACSISASTSTVTITESVTETYTFASSSSASNYTWSTTASASSSAAPYPMPNATYTANMTVNSTSLTSSTTSPTTITLLPETYTTDFPLSIPISATAVLLPGSSAVLHPSTTASLTTTITGGQATGLPDPTAFHCGVHGFPVGDYFLGEYVEDRANVAISLLGCYEFCEASPLSCFSYSFYHEDGTDAPRCALYGGSVADSLDSIIKEVPRVWFDIGCGNPVMF